MKFTIGLMLFVVFFASTRVCSADPAQIVSNKEIVITEACAGDSDSNIRNIRVAADGKRFATGDNAGALTVYDAADCRRIWTADAGFTLIWQLLEFFPDGSSILTVSNKDTLKIWDAATGKQSRTLLKLPTTISGIRVLPSGREALAVLKSVKKIEQNSGAGGAEGNILLIELESGKILRVWKAAELSTEIVAIAPAGNFVYAGRELSEYDLKLESTRRFSEQLGVGNMSSQSLPISGDGKLLVTYDAEFSLADAPNVNLTDARSGKPILMIHSGRENVRTAAFSANGRWFATGGSASGLRGGVNLWDLKSLKVMGSIWKTRETVNACGFSPDGAIFLTGGTGGYFHVWRISAPGQTPKPSANSAPTDPAEPASSPQDRKP